MKFTILYLVAAVLYLTPLYMFDTYVIPELSALQNTYLHADAADQLVTTR